MMRDTQANSAAMLGQVASALASAGYLCLHSAVFLSTIETKAKGYVHNYAFTSVLA